MTNQFPDATKIIHVPPPELVQRLCDKAFLIGVDGASRGDVEVWLIQEAFAAGADQELEACCKWLLKLPPWSADDLRKHRRPKPLSLKEQALIALHAVATGANDTREQHQDLDTIRRSLEQLND